MKGSAASLEWREEDGEAEEDEAAPRLVSEKTNEEGAKKKNGLLNPRANIFYLLLPQRNIFYFCLAPK